MNDSWPLWATLRAEQIPLLPVDQQGPWSYREAVCRVGRDGPHPTQPPYCFHCQLHIKEIRAKVKQDKPWRLRDQGLCVACGQPAELLPTTMNYRVACMQAEIRNSTVARLSTRRHCQQCPTNNATTCKGSFCRGIKPRPRVRRPNCCPDTKSGKRRHCSICCAAGKDRKPKPTRQSQGAKAGAASGAARRQQQHQRRREVTPLNRAGLTVEQIAQQLAVSPTTIRKDIAALRERTKQANAAWAQKTAERRDTIRRLTDQGLSPAQIAPQIGLTEKTVLMHLKSLDTTDGASHA